MLNDMRSAHFEDLQPVAKSEVLEDLKELVQKYKVEPYQEPKSQTRFDQLILRHTDVRAYGV